MSSLPSHRKAVIERAKQINGELQKTYPGADSLGAAEIAREIRRRTSRKRASTVSITNALRKGSLHDGRVPRAPIEHPVRRIWNVSLEAVALNIAEIIEGIALDVSVENILRGWFVVRMEPMEAVGAVAQERVVLDYRSERVPDPERLDAPDVSEFLGAVAEELNQLNSAALASRDRRLLSRVVRER
jgi:hypothetical protein